MLLTAECCRYSLAAGACGSQLFVSSAWFTRSHRLCMARVQRRCSVYVDVFWSTGLYRPVCNGTTGLRSQEARSSECTEARKCRIAMKSSAELDRHVPLVATGQRFAAQPSVRLSIDNHIPPPPSPLPINSPASIHAPIRYSQSVADDKTEGGTLKQSARTPAY